MLAVIIPKNNRHQQYLFSPYKSVYEHVGHHLNWYDGKSIDFEADKSIHDDHNSPLYFKLN